MPVLGLPLAQEIAYQDPCALFFALPQTTGSLLFDSAQQSHHDETNRYSYIVLAPQQTFQLKNGTMAGVSGIRDPFAQLQPTLAEFRLHRIPELPPFQGGLAGYFAYDLCHYLEAIPYPGSDDMNFPDLALGLYDAVISFDHHQQRAWVVATGYPARADAQRLLAAQQCIDATIALMLAYPVPRLDFPAMAPLCRATDIETNFNQDSYVQMVLHAQNYIRAGDISEVNLAQRFSMTLPDEFDAADLYRRVRAINPAPFAAYLNLGDVVLASASPECFMTLENGVIITRPIKGTRPRGDSPVRDQQLAQELLTSTKDRAENIMIVDLMRNDLSRVCDDDSVKVTQCCGLESYATVHHLVSVVTGHLRNDLDVFDLLRATLPGGSITGAPKIRAMEIIAECEPNRRGPYCGNIGYLSFTGDMALSVAIRTYAIAQQKLTYQAGGAVVHDSDPLEEYQESMTKARALTEALVGTAAWS